MKKLPLFFPFLLFACSAPKEVVSNRSIFNNHPEPYHIYTIGKWDANQIILTLTDAENRYFSIKTTNNKPLKRGDVYKPEVTN